MKSFHVFGLLQRAGTLVRLFTIHREASAPSAFFWVPEASLIRPRVRPIPSTLSWLSLPARFVSERPSPHTAFSSRERSFDHGLAQAGAFCLLVDRVLFALRFPIPTSVSTIQDYQAPFRS